MSKVVVGVRFVVFTSSQVHHPGHHPVNLPGVIPFRGIVAEVGAKFIPSNSKVMFHPDQSVHPVNI
jgi:hypothetical protein